MYTYQWDEETLTENHHHPPALDGTLAGDFGESYRVLMGTR